MTITPPTIPTLNYHISDPMIKYDMPDFTVVKQPDITLPGITWTYSFKYKGQVFAAPAFLGYE